MYKRIDFTQLEGLGLTQDTLDFLQVSYRDAIAALATFLGDFIIVTGVLDQGANFSDGWVAIEGELLPFVGGLKAPNVIIEEISATEQFADGSDKKVYLTRRAKLANSGGNPIVNFTRLKTAKTVVLDLAMALSQAASALANAATAQASANSAQGTADNALNAANSANSNANSKVAKAGDTMSGNLSIPAGTQASHAVNKGQLDSASPAVKFLGSQLTLANVTGSISPTISESQLPNCKMGFWCAVQIRATNSGDVGVLTYRLNGNANNIMRQVDSGYANNFNNSEFTWFCPLPSGSTGTFLMGHFVGSTAFASVKIVAYV